MPDTTSVLEKDTSLACKMNTKLRLQSIKSHLVSEVGENFSMNDVLNILVDNYLNVKE